MSVVWPGCGFGRCHVSSGQKQADRARWKKGFLMQAQISYNKQNYIIFFASSAATHFA